MPAARILYFSAHQIQAFRWHQGECDLEAVFDADAPGAPLTDYLEQNRRSLFTLLANVAEEGFHMETIPFLQAGDRQVVVRRRLNQLFQGSPFALDISLGYEKSRRKDEKLLLLGLTNPAQFDPAIRALRAAEVKLTGLFSIPLLSGALLERLKIPLVRTLLVSLQDHSIRQTYFDGGHMVLSRLAPISDSSVSGITATVGAEVSRFHQYLLSQRILGRNDALDAHVLLHPDLAQSVATMLPGHELQRFHVHDLASVGRALGLNARLPDSRCQALFAHLAKLSPPKRQFAPSPLRKEFRLWQASRAMVAAGVIGLTGALLFGAKTWFDISEMRSEASSKQADAITLDARYQAIVKTFPPVPIAKEALRQVVSRYASLESQTALPQDMIRELAAALDNNPNVELTRIEWAIGDQDGLSQRIPRGGVADRQILVIDGTISAGNTGSARDLLAEFERFSSQVLGEGKSKQELLILQQPFDVTSGTSLKSGSGSLSTNEPRPFSLALLRRVGA